MYLGLPCGVPDNPPKAALFDSISRQHIEEGSEKFLRGFAIAGYCAWATCSEDAQRADLLRPMDATCGEQHRDSKLN